MAYNFKQIEENANKLSLRKTSLNKEYLFMKKGKPKSIAFS
ncbi:MAG: hypothetical protein WC438_04870 [Candidatus Pacearchaeota archaeon]